MATFKFNLPSGNKFELNAPEGTTQAQADFIFYSQVAAGSLVGYTIGQTLTSAQASVTNFELSRLQRDTAGVSLTTILAIVTGETVTASIPSLANVPLLAAITAADFAATGAGGLGFDPVGPLTSDDVQGLITTTATYVDQAPDTVTDTGIGTYNLTPANLEAAGYLKPGTGNYPDFNCVIGTPSVWTGKDGVTSVAGILADPSLQTNIQNAVLQNNYDALVAGGAIQVPVKPPVSTNNGTIYGSAGLTTLTAAALVSGTAALTGGFNKLISSTFAGASSIGGVSAQNVSSLLTTPVNNISTLANGAVNSTTQFANNLTSTLSGTALATANATVNSTLQQATNLTNGVKTAANNAVGTLVNNAAQFTAPVAAAWAQGSAALNAGLGSTQGVLNSAVGEAKGLVTGAFSSAKGFTTNALGSLSGLASGTLGTLGTQAKSLLSNLGGSLDAFGKMSSFGMNFSLFSSDSLVSATKVAAGYTNTVSRQTVDAAVTRILGNAKIPTPSFEFPSELTKGINADIAFAQQKLKDLVA